MALFQDRCVVPLHGGDDGRASSLLRFFLWLWLLSGGTLVLIKAPK